jgi:hypothetical protein
MNPVSFAILAALLAGAPLFGEEPTAAIDLQKARQLFQRQQSGETLTPDERAYLERARAMRIAQAERPPARGGAISGDIDWDKARRLFQREQRGDKLSAEEQTYLDRAKELRKANGGGSTAGQRKAPEHLPPLCDMTASDRYEGEDGGLYGNGSNTPPEAHAKAAQSQLARIQPLDPAGKPAADGRIVLVSLSMSNATQEFSHFKQIADADPRKSPGLTIVDCAQGGQAMAEWAPPDGRPWAEAKQRLARAGVTPEQVQVAWVKLANKSPSGSLQEHGQKLEADTLAPPAQCAGAISESAHRLSGQPHLWGLRDWRAQSRALCLRERIPRRAGLFNDRSKAIRSLLSRKRRSCCGGHIYGQKAPREEAG